VVSLLHRQAVRAKAEGLFFQVSPRALTSPARSKKTLRPGICAELVQDHSRGPKVFSQRSALQGSRSAHQLRSPSVLQSRRGGFICPHRGAYPVLITHSLSPKTKLNTEHTSDLFFHVHRHSSRRTGIDGRGIPAGNPSQKRRIRNPTRGSHRMSKSRRGSRGASSSPSPWRPFRRPARAS